MLLVSQLGNNFPTLQKLLQEGRVGKGKVPAFAQLTVHLHAGGGKNLPLELNLGKQGEIKVEQRVVEIKKDGLKSHQPYALQPVGKLPLLCGGKLGIGFNIQGQYEPVDHIEEADQGNQFNDLIGGKVIVQLQPEIIRNLVGLQSDQFGKLKNLLLVVAKKVTARIVIHGFDLFVGPPHFLGQVGVADDCVLTLLDLARFENS